MTELTYDFQKSCNISPKVAEKKNVQFSSTSMVMIFERYDENEARGIWYTSRDYREMREDVKWSVINVNYHLISSRHVEHGHEDYTNILDETVGIEHLLNASIIRKSRHRKAWCIRAVLEEQAMQTDQVDDDVRDKYWERLAEVSSSHSEPGVKRAHKIGLLHQVKFDG